MNKFSISVLQRKTLSYVWCVLTNIRVILCACVCFNENVNYNNSVTIPWTRDLSSGKRKEKYIS